MGWPNKIYCATITNGVYYTSNFVDPGTQPIWSTVNGGLPATDVRQFALDPFAPATKQYLLLEATRTLYWRDNGGNWAAIITDAQAETLFGVTGAIQMFCIDPSLAGRLWIVFLQPAGDGANAWAAYSDDYGATWTAVTRVTDNNLDWIAFTGGIHAYGDTVFIGFWRQSSGGVRYSTNKGSTWGEVSNAIGNYIAFNPLVPDRVYGNSIIALAFRSATSAGASNDLVALVFGRQDAFWFSATNAAHNRGVHATDTKLYVTTDGWATSNAPSAISPAPISIAPWSGADEDQMIVGLTPVSGSQPHAIGVLYGEADVTAVGIAGANCETTPFADSIPDTCGGLAVGGIAAVEEAVTVQPVPPDDGVIDIPGGGTVTLGGTANVESVAMPGYLGDERGEHLPSDSSAWKTDTQAHAKLHAQDIKDVKSLVHLDPYTAANGNAPVFNSTTGLFVNTDVLTPTEHTAIGDGTPHHAAVTLGAGSDAALALAGQQLTLTLPAVPLSQTAVAAVILVAGDFVNIYNDGGTLKARFADCSLNRPADGYVLAGYAIGATATVYLEGHNTSLAGLTIGDMLYLSTIGDATATAPTTIGYIVQPIGQAFTATKAAFHREHTILLAT